ncbi:hypothetical protein [Microcoleus sp. CAWBG58]|nr:hypothetical protein [Microcoleus sp. CAWBG58]
MKLSIFIRDCLWRRTLRILLFWCQVRRREIVDFYQGLFVATHPTNTQSQ